MPLAPFNAKIQDYLGNKKIGKPIWDIYFGVELEYEVDKKSKFAKDNQHLSSVIPGQYENSPLVHHVCDVLTDKYVKSCHSFIKRDGSLSDGIEIVTLPTDIVEFQGSNLKGSPEWTNLFDNLTNYGLVVRSTCGMHVHVSREFLTHLQIGKILKFLHSKENFTFIRDVAGRTPPTKYANITDPKNITDVKRHGDCHDKRYNGFNLVNTATIEFRIFKSTLKLERVLTNIEFCDAIVAFTWPSNAGISDLTLDNFLNFIGKNRKLKYPNLFAFLVSKKYFSKPKKFNPSKNNKRKVVKTVIKD